jgi:16S rRNA (guanine527-N7)-methyltransferase
VVSRETTGSVPPLPDWLAPRAESLSQFVDILADVGVSRGLIGPREAPRLWSRHVLNCAVVVDPAAGLVPTNARTADVGSGAGLPGLVWAIARPDLQVTLIEPLLRRSTFLNEAIDALGLSNRVEVWRGRAEDAKLPPMQVVTARAVAPLERLIGWTVPLLGVGGRLIALKGSSALQEVQDAKAAAEAAGLSELTVREVGREVVDPPTTVVYAVRSRMSG